MHPMSQIARHTGGIAATNAYLISLPFGNVLVDAPEGVAEWLAEHGASVAALWLTHQHFDHVMDVAAVKAAHGCPIYSWAPYSAELTLERLFGAVAGLSMSVPPFVVDHVLGGEPRLELAGVDCQLFHIPGHSPDSVCYFLPEHGLLFGGDVLFQGSIGRTDFPGGSFAQLTQGIRARLWLLGGATRVLPGHGPETTIGEERASNPFVDQAATE